MPSVFINGGRGVSCMKFCLAGGSGDADATDGKDAGK
jgi:hypothetical protein